MSIFSGGQIVLDSVCVHVYQISAFWLRREPPNNFDAQVIPEHYAHIICLVRSQSTGSLRGRV